jgi:hypothetical protein
LFKLFLDPSGGVSLFDGYGCLSFFWVHREVSAFFYGYDCLIVFWIHREVSASSTVMVVQDVGLSGYKWSLYPGSQQGATRESPQLSAPSSPGVWFCTSTWDERLGYSCEGTAATGKSGWFWNTRPHRRRLPKRAQLGYREARQRGPPATTGKSGWFWNTRPHRRWRRHLTRADAKKPGDSRLVFLQRSTSDARARETDSQLTRARAETNTHGSQIRIVGRDVASGLT